MRWMGRTKRSSLEVERWFETALQVEIGTEGGQGTEGNAKSGQSLSFETSRSLARPRALSRVLELTIDEYRADHDLLDSVDPWTAHGPPPDLSLDRTRLDTVGLIGMLERRLVAIVFLQHNDGKVSVLRMGNCLDGCRVGIDLLCRLSVDALVLRHLGAVVDFAVRTAHRKIIGKERHVCRGVHLPHGVGVPRIEVLNL